MLPETLEHLLDIGRVGAGMYPEEVQAVVEYADTLKARNAELVAALGLTIADLEEWLRWAGPTYRPTARLRKTLRIARAAMKEGK